MPVMFEARVKVMQDASRRVTKKRFMELPPEKRFYYGRRGGNEYREILPPVPSVPLKRLRKRLKQDKQHTYTETFETVGGIEWVIIKREN